MAARNKPAGIRSLVYGIGKSKGGIEGLSVSGGQYPTSKRFAGRSLGRPPARAQIGRAISKSTNLLKMLLRVAPSLYL
jgi:hypothetical protein